MSVERKLSSVIALPPPSRGQFGPHHTAVEVIRPDRWEEHDPFILLMDDRADGTLQAGPHPHAGFETVSFLVEGSMGSEGGFGNLMPGDVEWTTAGSGIVHGPEEPPSGRMRLLQLWVTLPKQHRWTEPDQQLVRAGDAIVRREPGAEVRLYSGVSGGLRSPTKNRVPMTLVDVRLEPGAAIAQEAPRSHNGFFYVLEGEARIGVDATPLVVGQVGWLDRHDVERGALEDGEGTVRIANAGDEALRVLLYTGQRQNVPIVSYGPFIGDSMQDIARSFERYQAGTFRRY